ncbi:MAG: long-chain fatty acid--CoA ligase [Alphaproteobacteria bacterium]|nr:long-chain fatty acid--CoA ligase [Alphaproteobacteria bacterium]
MLAPRQAIARWQWCAGPPAAYHVAADRGGVGIFLTTANWQSLPAMFFERAAAGGDQPFLWAKHAGTYRSQSWREVASAVRRLARGLAHLGVRRGDRVVLVAENRPEWLIADLAILANGAVTVPAYTTNTSRDHLFIMENVSAAGVIVSTPALAENVLPAARLAALRFAVAMEPPRKTDDLVLTVHGWDAVLAMGDAAPDEGDRVVAAIRRDDLACIIHTSGTGGQPKGVMLSHRAILHNTAGAQTLLRELSLVDEVFLSFLPLSHSYEHTAGQFFPIRVGAQIYYAEGADAIARNMLEARPTIMTCVPRLYEVLRQRILATVTRDGGLKARLFRDAERLGRQRYLEPGSLGLLARLYDRLLDRLVRAKVKARFGGRIKALVSGGAPLNVDVGLFFVALGLPVLQGYGQTEAAPVVTCNPPRRAKIETVGPPLEGVEVRIAADGEILVRGELLMDGYWADGPASDAALQDGWLHTGDIGRLDADGYLLITDRKKDIIVVSGGDNVSPQRVEGVLTLQPEIAQAMVFGDRRPHLVGLVVPDAQFVEAYAKRAGVAADLAICAADKNFLQALAPALGRANQSLSVLERVKRFAVATAPFSIDNGLMTPTLKLRRHRILEQYRATLDALY